MAKLIPLHNHTEFSLLDGMTRVGELVNYAKDNDLPAIAITDHGFNQKLYGVRRKDIEKVKLEIEDAKERYPIDVLLGVEANIISSKGEIDINKEDYKDLDIVACGFHRLVKSTSAREQFKFVIKNILCEIFHHTSRKQREKNTNAYINAMRNYDIDIITHLNHVCKVDVEKVARVAKETNTLIELNGKRINFTKEDIDAMVATGVKFIIDSDAHCKENVGKNHRAFNLIEKYKIPLEQIANLDKLPKLN